MMKIIFTSFFLLLIGNYQISAQGLLDSLDGITNQPKQVEYTEATFKAPRLVNGQTVELIGNKEMALIIAHRFAPISEGAYNFYGLTQNIIRLGVDYGLLNRVNIGLGVGSYQRTFDGFIKILFFKQCHGSKSMPVTVVLSSTAFISAEKWQDPTKNNLFNSRLFYSYQLLIARKFSNRISIQVTPGIVHRNLVKREIDQNNVYSIAAGGRFKLTKQLALNAEYYYLLPGQTADDFVNSFSLGFDIETGGHVFQLLFTNSISPQEKVFIPETTHKWRDGDVHFGFNIIRVFGLSHAKKV